MSARIILHLVDGVDDTLLQLRAAKSALRDGIKPGDLWGIVFEDGSSFGVRCTKAGALSVWSNAEPPSSPDRGRGG